MHAFPFLIALAIIFVLTRLSLFEKVYIITELAAGGDLERRSDRRYAQGKQLYSEAELIPMFRILCKTVAQVHAEGWIHRRKHVKFNSMFNIDPCIYSSGNVQRSLVSIK